MGRETHRHLVIGGGQPGQLGPDPGQAGAQPCLHPGWIGLGSELAQGIHQADLAQQPGGSPGGQSRINHRPGLRQAGGVLLQGLALAQQGHDDAGVGPGRQVARGKIISV